MHNKIGYETKKFGSVFQTPIPKGFANNYRYTEMAAKIMNFRTAKMKCTMGIW